MRLVPPAIRHLLKEYARIKKKSLNFVKLKLSEEHGMKQKGTRTSPNFGGKTVAACVNISRIISLPRLYTMQRKFSRGK